LADLNYVANLFIFISLFIYKQEETRANT